MTSPLEGQRNRKIVRAFYTLGALSNLMVIYSVLDDEVSGLQSHRLTKLNNFMIEVLAATVNSEVKTFTQKEKG